MRCFLPHPETLISGAFSRCKGSCASAGYFSHLSTVPQSYGIFAKIICLETIKILRIWLLRLARSLLGFYNQDNISAFFIRPDVHLHCKTELTGISKRLLRQENCPETNVSKPDNNHSKSQPTTPNGEKVRANQSQTGPWQSE